MPVTSLKSTLARALHGTVSPPGDKSVSHRALILSAMAIGRTEIAGLLESEDVLRTADALRAMGVPIERGGDGAWRVDGVGPGGLSEPDDVIDLGNSGTSARLLMGLIATHPMTVTLTGDGSLRRRPMRRVAEPMELMGARIVARNGGLMPLTVIGCPDPVPIEYEVPVPSAQVKSAVMLAALNTPGETTVIEREHTRDHTERMMRHFGFEVRIEDEPGGRRRITVPGQREASARPIVVPGDPSSAAFAAAAACIVPGSDVVLHGIGLNPLRFGFFQTLREMGVGLEIGNRREESGEPVGDVRIVAGKLSGIDVPAERAPSMIDEYPVLAAVAACAAGTTRMRGLAELRVKESDRLAAIADGLTACGVANAIEGDALIVQGCGGRVPGGGRIETRLDHRMAMSFLVLGMASESPVVIDDGAAIATSYPRFVSDMNGLGAAITPADA